MKGNQQLHEMGGFSDWPVRVFCLFRGLCLHPLVKCFTALQRAHWWNFLKSLALSGESEQRMITGPQISANERVNIEPSSQLRVAVSWCQILAELQSVGKPDDIKDCSQLAERFTARINHKHRSNDEVRLIFADTKMFLHALDTTPNGAMELYIHSPDTDILVLPLRRYPELCVKTWFVAGTGDKYRVIGLGSALGSVKLAELPEFHAFSGADITGSFSGKGKLSCWKTFMDSDKITLAPHCITQTRYWPL